MTTARPSDETSEQTPVEELVATILGVRSDLDPKIAGDLVASCGGGAGLARAGSAEVDERLWLAHVPRSNGAARALVAAFELGRRVTRSEVTPPERITRSEDAA